MPSPPFMVHDLARLHWLRQPGGVLSSAGVEYSPASRDHQDIDYLQAVALTRRYYEQRIADARAQLLVAVDELAEAVVDQREFECGLAFDDHQDVGD